MKYTLIQAQYTLKIITKLAEALKHCLILQAAILILSVFYHTSLLARDETSELSFNPHSDYWPTSEWRYSSPEKQGMNSTTLTSMFDEIKEKQLNINSLIVVRNGYIVVEANRYYPELLHVLYSSTKSIASAVFGIALAEGHIEDIEQPLLKFYPELSQTSDNKNKSSINLKHLLTMSCAFEWPEVQLGYHVHTNPAFEMFKSPNTVQYILNKPVNQQPGQVFNYNSGCSHLLLAVLSRTGLNVQEFAHNRLFKPLGIKNYIWDEDSDGIPNGAGGLSMRTGDMAKFGYLYLKAGNWNGTQIIPEEWIKESTKKQIKMTWGGYMADYYGYQWYIQPFGFNSLGYGGQFIFVIPDKDLVVVFTSDLPQGKRTRPIDLVTNFIIPAVIDTDPLPENEENLKTLRLKSKKFEIH